MSHRTSRMARASAMLAIPVLALSLAACSQDPNSIAAQAKSGNRQGYISGDGTVEAIPVAQRNKPVVLSGKTLDDQSWSVAAQAGKVVVLNVWASWCPPCEKEAPELKDAAEKVAAASKPVVFMGINTRDNPDSGRATAKRQGIPYPSLDDQDGRMILALQGKAPTPPVTLVLDPTGRIAARVVGEVTSSTLTGLVDDVLAEK
ncbi:TlpA family protein disulfide reductase [Phycicoccus sp. Root101]|uniref:TlpA family protein disulfide reductase n=1 Tax=Phycicoccus sp. Root101 TaxID=1736421 RepID=UPI000702C851|nr:TlpA disulfide reductase family protein [Phycicoccus sp. Root101]KQU65521.1 redoxin [Phycicoccus sp. Root101]